jgi:hypothetical protein
MSFLGAQNSIALGVQGLIHIDTGGGAGGSADYLLAKSLRFRSSASAYLNRTPTATGSRTTFTWSGWVKRGALGTGIGNRRAIFASGRFDSPNNGFSFRFFDDQISAVATGGTTLSLTSSAVYRDPAAWYHFVLAVDTTQGTASDRVKIYVNGSQVTSFGTATYPSASQSFDINTSSYTAYSGTGNDTGTLVDYYDGEMAEVNFVDGQALAPTAFGASSIYNQWLPIKYAGTYGTNGFYLPFTNTASTSTLVADSSGNANNWTPNNISLTAGSTYDSLTDVPTLTSTTVANYAVLNPLDKGVTVTMSNGNLKMVQSGVGTDCFRASMALPATGKWYWEIKVTAIGSGGNLGVATQSSSLAAGGSLTGILSQYSGYYAVNGWSNSGSYTAWTTGDLIAVAVDSGTGIVTFYKNGSSLGAIPTALTASQTYFPFGQSTNSTYDFNFGQQPFTYTAPSGFLPLNTFNI